jgi:toxin ParE1/3/4
MPVVKVAAAAEEDLKEIWAYVAQHNPEAASKLIKEITSRFIILSNYPQMGREQYTLLVNLRSFAVKGYIIFYQPFENGVEILRVLHGARDIESIFDRFLNSL